MVELRYAAAAVAEDAAARAKKGVAGGGGAAGGGAGAGDDDGGLVHTLAMPDPEQLNALLAVATQLLKSAFVRARAGARVARWCTRWPCLTPSS